MQLLRAGNSGYREDKTKKQENPKFLMHRRRSYVRKTLRGGLSYKLPISLNAYSSEHPVPSQLPLNDSALSMVRNESSERDPFEAEFLESLYLSTVNFWGWELEPSVDKKYVPADSACTSI
jgi:hypothetical protein